MPGPVTQLLIKWSDGDQAAMNQLVPLVYAELRRLAASHIRREQPEHSLQATALVHEAFLRMVDNQRVSLTNRAQFFGLASKLMRNVLVDLARNDTVQNVVAMLFVCRWPRLTALPVTTAWTSSSWMKH